MVCTRDLNVRLKPAWLSDRGFDKTVEMRMDLTPEQEERELAKAVARELIKMEGMQSCDFGVTPDEKLISLKHVRAAGLSRGVPALDVRSCNPVHVWHSGNNRALRFHDFDRAIPACCVFVEIGKGVGLYDLP